jgi:hypothetical protein
VPAQLRLQVVDHPAQPVQLGAIGAGRLLRGGGHPPAVLGVPLLR